MYCARVVQRRYRKVNVAGVLWVVLLPAGSGPRWWFACLLAVYRRYTAQLEAKQRRVHNKWKICNVFRVFTFFNPRSTGAGVFEHILS